MSGVFGIVDPGRKIEAGPLAKKMAAGMSHREWYVNDIWADETRNLALGRLGIGIFNKGPQPIWNSERTIALMMAGEIYKVRGRDMNDSQQPEQTALSLYEESGHDFAQHLNGAFVVAIWDQGRNRLVVANDRFGLYTLFYAHYAGRLIFAPEVKGILCDATFPRKPDMTALAQYMRFQHLLGERTFFEDIHFLPNASMLVYDLNSATCAVTPYWTFKDIPHRPDVEFGEAVEEVGRLMRRAVRRLSGDHYRPGVYLSGGLDSRTILGMIDRRPVASMTFGVENCRDVVYGRQIARAAGSDHYWTELKDGNWIKDQVDFHLELTEGFHSWIHAHGLSSLPQARQIMDLNLTGWDGGTVMGHDDSIEQLQIRAVDDLALTARLFYLFNQKYTWPSLTEAEEQGLYTESAWKQMKGLAFDSFRTELSRYLDHRPDVRAEYFYIRSHCDRLTHHMVTFARSHIETRFPFLDYELFEFLYSIPAEVRGHRKLYRAMIQRETPNLAYVPYDHDEFLPTTRALIRETHAAALKLKRRFNRHVRPIFTERPTLYADYENYLRTDLRDWAESILYDPRLAGRGLFRPEFVRSLMNRHLSGQEEWTIGKIAPIITYEMMLRRLYD